DISVDPSRRHASRGGRQLELGPKEFGVLELLLSAQGRVVSAEELLERGWDEMADPFTTAGKVTISRLRGKRGEPPANRTVGAAGVRRGGPLLPPPPPRPPAVPPLPPPAPTPPPPPPGPRPRFAAAWRLRLPRRTVRLRLTVLYGSLFLVCGAALLGVTYIL